MGEKRDEARNLLEMTSSVAIAEAMEQRPVIRLVNLEQSFGAQAVLKGVNPQIPRGNVTTVIGPSGSSRGQETVSCDRASPRPVLCHRVDYSTTQMVNPSPFRTNSSPIWE